VVHGSVGRDDPRVGLRIDVGDLEMFVTIVDDGDGLKPRPRAAGETHMGAGLAIIAALTGRLDVRTGSEGTELRLTFPCSTAGSTRSMQVTSAQNSEARLAARVDR